MVRLQSPPKLGPILEKHKSYTQIGPMAYDRGVRWRAGQSNLPDPRLAGSHSENTPPPNIPGQYPPMSQSPPKVVPLVAIAAAVTGLFSASLGWRQWQRPEQDALQLARSVSSAYQQLAEEVGPAVVQVKAYRKSGSSRRTLQEGSGVIIQTSGLTGTVVTNQHVISGSNDLLVVLTSGRALPAKVLGADPDTDLAVLSIEAAGLTAAPLAPESKASVGEIVLAMGNPLGLGHTVTAGIVSGLGRSDLNITFYEDFIQIDAAINMGNSGGPLINLNGEVLGINTAIGVTNADNALAFSIPSHMVRRSVEDILRFGEVRRGYLGVENHSRWRAERILSAARTKGFEGVSRIAIANVTANSPASAASLAVNDIVLAIDGTRISDQRSFRTAIADVPPGEETTVLVWREGKELTLPVTLVQRK